MRHVMFQAALVAAHHNPSLKSFADRLRKAGKPHKVIVTAVARKLVTIANALCKSRQKWTAAKAREIQLLGRSCMMAGKATGAGIQWRPLLRLNALKLGE